MMSSHFVIVKTRSTLQVIKDASVYVSAHARALIAAIGTMALPTILAGNIVLLLASGSYRGSSQFLHYAKVLNKGPLVLFLLGYAIYVLGFSIYNLAINRHMLLVSERKENEVSFHSIRNGFNSGLKTSVPNFLIMFVVYFAAWELCGLLSIKTETAYEDYYSAFDALFTRLTNSILELLPVLLIMPACFYLCLSALFVSYRDQTGVSEALQKVWRYTKQKPAKAWLGTAAICTILFILITIIQIAFNYLYTLLAVLNISSDSLFFILWLMHLASKLILLIYFQVAVILLYGSAEDETEGSYVKEMIEKI